MALSALITIVPLLTVGIIGRFLKLNYLTICGLLSGSMTDPPALEFANSLAPGQIQSSAYAIVYPLTMFLRILFAQIFVLLVVWCKKLVDKIAFGYNPDKIILFGLDADGNTDENSDLDLFVIKESELPSLKGHSKLERCCMVR